MRYTAKKTTVRKTVVKKVGETFWPSFKTNIGYPKFGKWIKKKWKTVKKIWKKIQIIYVYISFLFFFYWFV